MSRSAMGTQKAVPEETKDLPPKKTLPEENKTGSNAGPWRSTGAQGAPARNTGPSTGGASTGGAFSRGGAQP